jgi:hypothetical protein
MSSKPTDTQRNNSWEADRLEEERQHQHRQPSVLPLRDGGRIEDQDTSNICEKDISRLYEPHQERTSESPYREAALSSRQELRTKGRGSVASGLSDVVDKIPGYGDLSTSVAELCESRME